MANPADASLDAILVQLGDFGKYQIYVFTLVCIPIILHSSVHVAYVFTAMDLNYRCEIPACDSELSDYEPPWLINTIPYVDGKPVKCETYMYNNFSEDSTNGNCSFSDFDRKKTRRCTSFVYQTNEKSILQEYNLQCSDNLWKLPLVGSMNSFGQFSGLFVAGMLSDRYGRRPVMVWGMILCAICGLMRTLMPSYELFLLFEYLDAAFSAGTLTCGFVLAVELVGPNKRVLTGSIAACGNALGSILTTIAAWTVKSWRPLIYILYTPPFFLLSYFWIIPESIRWNLKKGRIEEAKATLKKLAKVNGKEITEKTLGTLNIVGNEQYGNGGNEFIRSLKSSTLSLRFTLSCFCWITCGFVFYGLSLNSVSLAGGNRYLNYILTALVEIPAQISCSFFLTFFGRRKTACGSFLLTGACCIVFIFISSDVPIGSLSVYLLGKFGVSLAFTTIYVYTSEMFPTTVRQSFISACSTFARLGVMIAPQMPLLANIWTPLPLVCFSGMSITAGCLTLLLPETLNIKLPDTIEEAENISKSKNYLEGKFELQERSN